MEYDVYLRREVLDFLRTVSPEDRTTLLGFLQEMANNPFRTGDFQEIEPGGRVLEVVILRGHAVLYWSDHAVKEVKVTDIRPADRHP